jgi:methyl-accepting chemotaxis protein
MVESLTEARHNLFDTTISNLSRLIEKLESNVSELPGAKTAAAYSLGDNDSDIEDPSELFHRDIGTQTSEPPIPLTTAAPADQAIEPAAQRQLSALADMVERLQSLSREYVSQGEDITDIKTALDLLTEDVERLASERPPTNSTNDWMNTWNSPKKEPDDEVKKAKDSIRRIKGVLLSTRNFPTSTR